MGVFVTVSCNTRLQCAFRINEVLVVNISCSLDLCLNFAPTLERYPLEHDSRGNIKVFVAFSIFLKCQTLCYQRWLYAIVCVSRSILASPAVTSCCVSCLCAVTAQADATPTRYEKEGVFLQCRCFFEHHRRNHYLPRDFHYNFLMFHTVAVNMFPGAFLSDRMRHSHSLLSTKPSYVTLSLCFVSKKS